MNFLLFNYEYPPVGGGAGAQTQSVAKGLVKLGHGVFVLTSGFKDNVGLKKEDGVQVFRLKTLRKYLERSNVIEMFFYVFFASVKIFDILKKQKIDGTVSFLTLPSGPLSLLCKIISKIPYIIFITGGDVPGSYPPVDPLHKILAPIRRKILSESVINLSGSTEKIVGTKIHDNVDVKLVPSGVDTDFFSKPEKTKKADKDNVFKFCYVGRFQYPKNLGFMFEGLAKLSKISRKKFILYLGGDGPDKDNLIRLVKKLNFNQIKWLGWLNKEQVKEIYRECDCFIHTSLSESSPNSILEALSCGVPVVASDIKGHTDIVFDGKNGLLYKNGDLQDFSNKLKMILEDNMLRKKLSANARKIAVQRFSLKKAAEIYVNYFIENKIENT